MGSYNTTKNSKYFIIVGKVGVVLFNRLETVIFAKTSAYKFAVDSYAKTLT